MPVFATPLFTANVAKQSYLFNQSDFSNRFDAKQSISLPLVHDSEWKNKPLDEFLSSCVINPRSHLSTQVKHIFNKPLCFFTDYAISESGNGSLLSMGYDFIVQDYLKQFGIDSTIGIDESDIKYPFLDIWLYSFFGIVDITLLAKPDSYIADCIKQGLANENISHEKRITTEYNKSVPFPIIISLVDIDGNYHPYKLRLRFIDIGALHGNVTYKKVCDNVGIDTSAKSLMDKYKTDMLTGLKLYPQEYITYANGDLNVYDVLVAYNDLMKSVYNDLDLSDYFQLPKLTIGATVVDIISAAIFNWQGLEPCVYHNGKHKKSILKECMELASADYLKTCLVSSHKYLLGKIHGGRCHNNNPLMRYSENAIADYDIAGAYSSIMQQLPLFIGKPWFYDSSIDGEKTLKEFLRCHETDFDNWHYVVYVATNELLDYDQDFLVTWKNPNVIKEQKTINGKIKSVAKKHKFTDKEGKDVFIAHADYKSGACQIYKREVVNTPITSDTVKWIKSLSKQARNDLLNKLIVKSAIGYKRKDKDKTWFSINLGELLINRLKSKRAYYKGLSNSKTDRYNSLQELFKLIINTMYGDFCSKFFVTSNVVLGNNITQAIRLGMYLMEKGLNLQGSITDGCMGNIGMVVYMYDGYKARLNNFIDLYLENNHTLKNKHMYFAPLDNAKSITLSWDKLDTPYDKITHLACLTIDYGDRITIVNDELIDGKLHKNVNKWIDTKSWEHLNNLFPDFAYLLSFLKIETKDVYDSYVYHGAANYELKNPNHKTPLYAMRGYNKKSDAIAILYDKEDNLIKLPDYDDSSIPQEFLSQLHNGKLKKLPAFIKPKILKAKEFKAHNYIERSELQPGDNITSVGLPNYCSLSQFTFLTIKQREEWERAASRLKAKYQETFEVFFTDKNDMLDYDLMNRELCRLVNSGCTTPIKDLSFKYKINPSIQRAATKMKAAKLRNELTFTKTVDKFIECDDRS